MKLWLITGGRLKIHVNTGSTPVDLSGVMLLLHRELLTAAPTCWCWVGNTTGVLSLFMGEGNCAMGARG